MAYDPTTWIDEVLDDAPPKYTITDDIAGEIAGSATIDLADAPMAGTARNAANLNHLEAGVAEVEAETVPSILTAKGDLAVGSAPHTASILGVGAAGTYLVPDSNQAPGMKWATTITHGVWTRASTGREPNVYPSWPNIGFYFQPDITYLITPSSEFGIPAGVKAVFVNMMCQWIYLWHHVHQSLVYIVQPGIMSLEQALLVNQVNEAIVDTAVNQAAGLIPLDENGQFAVRVVRDNAWFQLTILGYIS